MAVTITSGSSGSGSNYVVRGNNATVTFASSSMPVIRKADFEFSCQPKVVNYKSMKDWSDLNRIIGMTNGTFSCIGEVTSTEMYAKLWPLSDEDLTTLNANCDAANSSPLITVTMSSLYGTNSYSFYGVMGSPVIRRGNKSLVEITAIINYIAK